MKAIDTLSNLIGKSISLANLELFLNKIQLGYKDKLIIVLGETGAGKSTFINSITQTNKCPTSNLAKSCTQDLLFVKLFDSGYNYYFIDTPGLNDSSGDKNHIQLLEKLAKKGILTTIILVQNYYNVRLKKSEIEILKTYMKIFPSENFWEHVLLVESFFMGKIDKTPVLDSITSNEELLQFMKDNQINMPNEIKEYNLDLSNKYEANKDIYNNILANIKNMHPLYKRYHEDEEFKIFHIIGKFGKKLLKYEHLKHIRYTDFDNNKNSKIEVIDSGEYPEENIKPEQIIVEREKTDEYRNYFWSFFPCWDLEYRIKYYEVKQYNFHGYIYEIKSLAEETWESDKEKDRGEHFRRNIESEANKNYGFKA